METWGSRGVGRGGGRGAAPAPAASGPAGSNFYQDANKAGDGKPDAWQSAKGPNNGNTGDSWAATNAE